MKIDESVWWCKRLPPDDTNDEVHYAAPVEIKTALRYFTVMGKSGYSDLLEFGENISQYLTAIAQPYETWKGKFSVGDLFYCDHNEPNESEEFYGQKANYAVDYVDYGNVRIKLTLKRIAD